MAAEGLQKFLKQLSLGTSECPLGALVRNHRKPQENAPWSPGLLCTVGEGHVAGHLEKYLRGGAVSSRRTKRLISKLKKIKKEKRTRTY